MGTAGVASPDGIARQRQQQQGRAAVRNGGDVAVALLFAAAVAVTALFAGNTLLGDPGSGLSQLLGGWGNAAGGVLCAAVCLLRARQAGPDRLGWSLIGLGVGSWALGNAYFSVAYLHGPVPVPSIADLLFIGLYPLAYVGIVLLARRRMRQLGIGLWLDGLIAAVATVALLGIFVLGAVIDAYHGDLSLALVINVAYPIGDLVLLALAAGGLVLGGRSVGRGTLAGALAALTFVAADSFYVVGNARGTYAVGGVLDAGWLLGALLGAYAAIVWDPRRAPRTAGQGRAEATLLVPIVSGTIAVAVLVAHLFAPFATAAEVAALAALWLVVVRMGTTLLENRRMLAALNREATTDALTGLGNRRRLFRDLGVALGERTPVGLVVFDLDGFKIYNDTFGHGAGDRLLQRIAEQLLAALPAGGRAYRLGGDELCAVTGTTGAPLQQLGAQLAERLAQCGDGFRVTAAFGTASTADLDGDPGEDADALLRRADRRMYEEKYSRRPSAASQAVDALLAIVDERHPSLSSHVNGVAALAHQVAADLGLRDAALDAVDHAAALHDVGKVAIPDEILSRRGPLDAEEWAFMRQHTIIGARVLHAVPALRSAAPLVRASHERWDGSGYPDGLRGEQIPLGAAVISACDALDAMLEERPYQPARTPPAALAELRRCSGTQFDPRVVTALCAAVEPGACRAAPA